MKTTVEISDALLREARKFPASEGVEVRTLIESGLRGVISQRTPRKPFQLRDASFCGNGLQQDIKEAVWNQLRDMAYDHSSG